LLLKLPHGDAPGLDSRLFAALPGVLVLYESGDGVFELAAREFGRVDGEGDGSMFDILLHGADLLSASLCGS